VGKGGRGLAIGSGGSPVFAHPTRIRYRTFIATHHDLNYQ
jgi:hypothetical protein